MKKSKEQKIKERLTFIMKRLSIEELSMIQDISTQLIKERCCKDVENND